MNKETKREINEMLFLMERMDKHYTGLDVETLKENIDELDARDRRDMSPAEFFNMGEHIKGGIKSTIGYVTAAELNVPKIKKINPATNRMKDFNDWDTFGKNIGIADKIGGVIKFSRYTFNWRSVEGMKNHYQTNYVEPVNKIRAQYGIAPIQPRQNNNNPLMTDTGTPKPQSVLGQGYFMQDTGGKDCHKIVEYFLVGTDGKIIKYPGTQDGEIPVDILKVYFKKYAPVGVSDLRKMNASDETIEEYAAKLAEIKFRYTRLNTGSIVYVITNINGEKLRFFNDNLADDIKEIKIDPQEYLNLAKHLYQLDSAKQQN